MFKKTISEEEKAKNEQERQKLMEKLGLDKLSDKDLETVKEIMIDLAGFGGTLGQLARIGYTGADSAIVGFLGAITRQNWIIIRQLNKLNRELNRFNSEKSKSFWNFAEIYFAF